MRRILKVLTSRLLLVAPLIALQFAFLVVIFYRMTISSILLPVLSAVSVVLVFFVLNRNADPSYKLSWCIVILASPVIGVPLYLLAGNRKVPKKLFNGTIRANEQMEGLLEINKGVLHQNMDDEVRKIFFYGERSLGFPVYENTESRYFPSGEAWFPVYLQELKKAERFIFIEYFIIDDGTVLDELVMVLKQKAAEGVEVKMIYDDFGSVTLPLAFERDLRSYGIEVHRFNRLRPRFIIQMNNRDHRKITVIDNKVAFTGGVNLADEYVNRIKRFGYWKDSAIMLKGEAVRSFTVMFLGMLSYCRNEKTSTIAYHNYMIPSEIVSGRGLYMPYSDTPTDEESVAMTMHVKMVLAAKRYVYIDTPYLILNESMRQALMIAAKSNVDVRLLLPHIPDKKQVFQITKSFYKDLLKAGVKIYEFTPGFNHCKNFVADDMFAIVGSANTDYRSYFLHFENGVFMYNTDQILAIRDDFLNAIEKSHQVTIEEEAQTAVLLRMLRGVLRIFIPLV